MQSPLPGVLGPSLSSSDPGKYCKESWFMSQCTYSPTPSQCRGGVGDTMPRPWGHQRICTAFTLKEWGCGFGDSKGQFSKSLHIPVTTKLSYYGLCPIPMGLRLSPGPRAWPRPGAGAVGWGTVSLLTYRWRTKFRSPHILIFPQSGKWDFVQTPA